MRLIALPLVAGLVVGLAGAQQSQDEARAILEKAITAEGGEAFLKKYQAATIKSKGTIDVPGLGNSEIVQEISFQLPNKFRDESTLDVNGMQLKLLTVFDGKKGFVEVNGQKPDLGDKLQDTLREAAQLLPVSSLVPLRDKAYELSVIGEAQVNGKPAIGIRAAKKGQRDVSIYFDKKSHLLVKVEHRTTDLMSGQELTQERIFTEFGKDEDGRPTPKRLVINRDGKKFLEAEIVETKHFEKLDDGMFMVP
jgi:hypothetical protein